MTLIGIKGKNTNHSLLILAAKKAPSLLIDAAGCANPHSLYPFIDIATLENVFVIEAEMIYKFRDSISHADRMAKRLGAKCIVVTTFDWLFNYDDKEENEAIFSHCWQLMKKLSVQFEVIVGVGKSQLLNAQKYCGVVMDGAYGLESKSSIRLTNV